MDYYDRLDISRHRGNGEWIFDAVHILTCGTALDFYEYLGILGVN